MRAFFIILAILTANYAVGQNTVDHLSDKAFDFYLNRKQFDSSLYYYHKISQDFPDESPLYISNQIADCYLELGDTASAEKYYLKCLSFDKHLDSIGFSQVGSCYSLSNIYYNRKQFRQALTYLEYTKTKYRPIRMLCQGTHGGYEGRLTFAYRKSLCYYGLNKKDSAIGVLAPLIFRPIWDVYLDSLEYEEMTRFFVNTVFEVYGAPQARDALQQALKNITYNPSYEEDERFNTIMFSVDCFIIFAKTKIYLDGGGGYQVHKKGEIPEFFSKDTLIKVFTDSPAFKYIMTNEGQPITGVFNEMWHWWTFEDLEKYNREACNDYYETMQRQLLEHGFSK